ARTAGSDAQTASASARVQGGGYLAATLAPPFAGWLNTATSGWTAPLLLVFAATASFAVTGLLAARRAGRFPRGGAGGREILDAGDLVPSARSDAGPRSAEAADPCGGPPRRRMMGSLSAWRRRPVRPEPRRA